MKFEAGIALDRGSEGGVRVYFPTWINLHACLAECLLVLGQPQEARDLGDAALRECEARGSADMALELIHVIALAETALGDSRAAQRLDALIARQSELGATGLRMGLSYEARARVAIATGDAAAFEHFSELAAREYRHGARTPLAARYERLMNEAARVGMQATLTMAKYQALAGPTHSALDSELLTTASRIMTARHSTKERATAALDIICKAHGARAGHLFLIAPAGPLLCASKDDCAPPDALAHSVATYISEQQRRATELDDMATSAGTDAHALPAPVSSGDRIHQLLMLRCMVDGATVLVGVAALECDGGNEIEPQVQLLNLLSMSLLESGEAVRSGA